MGEYNYVGLYILENGVPVLCMDSAKWGKWMSESKDRFIHKSHIEGDIYLSTVFLGIDHGFGSDEPVLFETSILRPVQIKETKGLEDMQTWRSCTLGEAKHTHFAVSAKIREAMKEGRWPCKVKID